MISILDNWVKQEDAFVYCKTASLDEVIVLEDDGFLPGYTISPYRYYVRQQTESKTGEGAPLFADLLPVPELWEIVMYYDRAEIRDEGAKKAEIEYAEPVELHCVKTVRWFLPDGTVFKADHYDRFGRLYYEELLDVNGSVNVRTYLAEGRPVLVCQPGRSLWTLTDGSRDIRMFDSEYSLLAYFIRDVFPDETLFVTDSAPITEELSARGLLCRLADRFETVFPQNPCGEDAYILTHSDQVEQLEYLVVTLPQLHFHVAAVTLMSDKLMCLDKYPNVSLYPGVSEQKRRELLRSCSWYLDINHYQEICDAVYEAYRHNLLIVGFDSTLHNRAYVLPQCVFQAAEADKMATFLKKTFEQKEILLDLTAQQGMLPLKEILCENGGSEYDSL